MRRFPASDGGSFEKPMRLSPIVPPSSSFIRDFIPMASWGKRRRKPEQGGARSARDAGEGAVSAEEDFTALDNDARWDLLFLNPIERFLD